MNAQSRKIEEILTQTKYRMPNTGHKANEFALEHNFFSVCIEKTLA